MGSQRTVRGRTEAERITARSLRLTRVLNFSLERYYVTRRTRVFWNDSKLTMSSKTRKKVSL